MRDDEVRVNARRDDGRRGAGTGDVRDARPVALVDDAGQARQMFWAVWAGVLLLKLMVAARLPLFVDEAFYWQEGQHLAAAYSDLPGMTAWLTRLGVELGGEHPF